MHQIKQKLEGLNKNKRDKKAIIKNKIYPDLPLISFCLFLFSLFLVTLLIGNDKVFLFINKTIANPVLDFIVLYVFIPLFFLLAIVPFLMLFSKKYRFLGLFALILGILSYLIGDFMKPFFAVPRPYEFLPARILGSWHPGIFSFPSTTTMLAFGLSLPIFLKQPKSGIFLLLLSFLVGFSVIYTGFHTPYDVLAGIFFSLILYLLLLFLINFIQKIIL